MNINDIYEANIKILIKFDYGVKETIAYSKFVKKAVVYRSDRDDYYDLSTNQRYRVNQFECFEGEMFIDSKSMVPIRDLIDARRDNMTKRKILKKYKEKNGGKK